jgi:hypothetical protein
MEQRESFVRRRGKALIRKSHSCKSIEQPLELGQRIIGYMRE